MKKFRSLFVFGLFTGAVVIRAAPLDTWHLRQSPATNAALNGIANGNGQFVAVGESGTILTSPDGTNWVSRVSGTTQTLWSVVFGPDLFVAVGNSGTTLTSPDGVAWSLHVVPPVPPSSSPLDLPSVTYGQGLFVAGANYLSADGTNWSVNPNSFGPSSLCFGNGVFASLLVIGFGAPYLYTSTNATNWSGRLWWPEFPTAKAIAFGAGRFVAVGGDNDLRYASMITSVSTNGVDWSAQKVIGTQTFLRSVTYGGSVFFALGYGGVLATSNDGFSWSTSTFPPTPALRAAAFGADTYVVVGDNGTILQSDSFTAPPPPPPPPAETRFLGITPGSPAWISISGPMGKEFRVEYADDLATNQTWNSLGQFYFSKVKETIADTNTITGSRRFYRAVVLP